MTRRRLADDHLSAFLEKLHGPLGRALRQTGVTVERRLRDQSQTWCDLSDLEIIETIVDAFAEVATNLYPGIDPAQLASMLATMKADMLMQAAANTDGGETVN